MTITEFEQTLSALFGADILERYTGEWGITARGCADITRLGYAVNLTTETVTEAAAQDVNLLLTHHDAWPFLGGMKEECLALLCQANISHCFVHAPLDAADFGTSAMLAQKLGARILAKTHPYEGLLVGRLCEFDAPLGFDELRQRIADALGEPIRAWKNRDWPIQRLDIATGGGMMTNEVEEAVNQEADAYLTGESVLYTVQYARYTGIDLFVGSHTFTEIFGVEGLATRLQQAHPEIEIVQVAEAHWESGA